MKMPHLCVETGSYVKLSGNAQKTNVGLIRRGQAKRVFFYYSRSASIFHIKVPYIHLCIQ